jgi:PPP family 3-phenylpropionic acid transporter
VSRLAAFYFAYFLALGAHTPYFALWLDTVGASAGQISVMLGLWYGTRVFAPSLWAHLVARWGFASARWWLRGGCLGTLLACALFLLPLPFAGLLLVMLLFSSLYNAVMPQFEALTLDFLGARRDRYARIRVWGSIGFLLANLGFGAALEYLGYAQLIWLLLPTFALLAWTAWLAPEPAHPSVPVQALAAAPSALPAPTLNAALRRLLWIAFLMQLTHGPLYVYLSLFLSEHGWSAVAIGQFWALGVLAEIGLFYCMPHLLRRFSAIQILAACLLAGGVRWPLLAAFPDSLWVVASTQLLHALTFAAFHAALMPLISKDAHGAALRRVQALLYGLGSGGGGVAGALLAGALWLWVGHAQAFVAAGVISVLTLLLLPGLRRRLHPQLETQHA